MKYNILTHKKLLFLVALSSSLLACSFSASAQLTDLIDFNGTSAPTGYGPTGSLIRSGNKLFGMTDDGGVNQIGNIFSIDTNGNNYTDIYDFQGTDGLSPQGSLTFSITQDTLFGMTENGGKFFLGNAFSIDTTGNHYNDIIDFSGTNFGGPNGQNPLGSLLLSVTGDTLFGMTSGAGGSGYGNIFSVATNGSNYLDMQDFDGVTNGGNPHGSLTFSVTKDTLFGMTSVNDLYLHGNIFCITTNASAFADLYNFTNGAINSPYGSLLLSGSQLYGMSSDGYVFGFNPNGNVLTNLSYVGNSPFGDLIISNNTLYGMTSGGGSNGEGNIFSINTSGTNYVDIVDFTALNGQNPQGDLLQLGTKFYGMTQYGGLNGVGVVFSLDTVFRLSIIDTTNPNTCALISGSATANAVGGTTPYTYLWNDASSQTTAIAQNLNAGTYTVYVFDVYGAEDSASVTLTQPTPVVINSQNVLTNVSCHGGNNGSGVLSVSGGTPPYYYNWVSPNGTFSGSDSLAIGLVAGNYSITVSDHTSCMATTTVVITQPPALTTSGNLVSNLNCNGDNGGIASVSAIGGILPYTYLWNDANSQTMAIATGLAAGTYTVIVTDSCGGDISYQRIIISQPTTLISAISSQTNVACYGGVGDAIVSTNGGISPYTYLWNDASSQTTAAANNLTAGNYTLTVTDGHGCNALQNVDITQPVAVLGINIATHTDVSCNRGNNGSAASFAATGGTSPYIYTWSNGSANLTDNGLSAGTYTISVADNHGCSATSTIVTITQPQVLGITMASHTDISCYEGNSTGIAIANAAIGGTAPYTYLWNDPNNQTTTTATGLGIGDYTVTVTDNNSCSAIARVYIYQPTPVTVAEYSEPATGTHNGVASVIVSGGILPYTYSWSPGEGTTSTITGLRAGGYCCSISDNNDCTQTVCVQVAFVAGIENISNLSTIKIYPDPTSGNFTITSISQRQVIELYNCIGEKLSSTTVTNNTTMHFDISDKSNGVYLIRILDNTGNLVSQQKVVKTN